MKQSFLPLALISVVALCFSYRHENRETLPTTVAPLPPCDSSVILAVQEWRNQLPDTPADAAAENLEKILNGHDCYDWVIAEAWHKLGNKYEKTDYSKAREYFQKALSLRLPVLGKEHKDVLRSTHMIGCMYSEEKDYRSALIFYDSANIRTKESAVVPYIRNLMMMGMAYLRLKELSRSKMYLQMAYDSIKSKEHTADSWLSSTLNQYSACSRLMGQFEEAIEAGKESLKSISVSDNPLPMEAHAYIAIGNAYQDWAMSSQNPAEKQSLLKEAIFYSKKASEIYQKLQDEELLILTLGNIGELYRRAEQPDEALKVLSAVLDTQPSKNAPGLAPLYINRGETWMDKGDSERALGDYRSALGCLAHDYQPGEVLPALKSVPASNRFNLLLTLSDIASAQLAQSNTSAAAVTFDTLLTLLNLIRGDFLSDEAKIALAGDSRQVLEKAFGGYVQLYEATGKQEYLERALSISEQRKSFALLEAARLNNADASLPDDLRQEKRDLAKEQADIEQRMLAYWNIPDSVKNLKTAQLRNLERSREWQLTVKEKYPKYDRLKQKGSDLDIATIQKEMLSENQAMLQYFCRDTVLDIFLIGKNSFKRYTSRIDRLVLEEKVNKFLEFSANPSTGGERDTSKENTLSTLAHELYLALLKPVKNDLPKRIIIIPDAPFTTLPFEALAMNKIVGDIHKQIENRNFVLFEHSTSYCFSANLLREMQQSETPGSLKSEVAGFAPHFPERLVAGANLPVSFVNTVKDLKPLGNKDEVKAIAKNDVDVAEYLDAAATVDGFFEACQRYAFVHVATHGILNQDPNLNFVAFTQNKDTLDHNELLFLRRLYTENLPQDLIVFSACETTLGEFREGEGNMSMARGLAYAGVRSFVTTLWKVYTASNTEIMPEFYQRFLNEKKPKDVALADAKVAFITASPDNERIDKWAGLVLIGSTETTHSSNWAWWVVAAVALGGLLFFGAKRRSQSSK